MAFEDLDVWKRSARLSAEIYKATTGIKDFGFRDQLTRSGVSVPSNIAEGLERDSNNEIARFLSNVKGSAGELRTQIYIGIEARYLSKEMAHQWIDETKQLGKILGSMIKKYRLKSEG
jgi:four helix bundle protein